MRFSGEQSPSDFEKEREEFQKCYKCAANNSNEDAGDLDNALEAFDLWWAKRHAERDNLQQTKQRFSHLTL